MVQPFPGPLLTVLLKPWHLATYGSADQYSRLIQSGFEIVHCAPIVDVVTPTDFTWAWPEAFLRTNANRLIELGELSSDDAEAAITGFESVKSMPAGRMVTPIVLEVIARRP